MRRYLPAAACFAVCLPAFLAPSAGHAQTVYPIDRADILTGARFDFKVEFPGLVDPAKLSVTLNGEDHAKLFGKAATFVEREDGKDQSALILRDVSLSQPGNYKVRVTDGTQTRELDWKQRGYMVALPLRRGYGETGGPWRENYGSCGNPDYYRAGLVTAEDIQAAIGFFRARSDVARDRILLIGWSAGGWGSLAADSQNPPGVFAVLNFAGGRGGNPLLGNCTPRRLVDAAGRYGATARVPSQWLYAANDKFFAPDLSRRMFDAFVRAGGKADYVALPAFGADGHRIFPDGRALWQPPVETFLATIKP